MFGPLLAILAKYKRLPKNFDALSIHAKIEELILAATEDPSLVPAVAEINRALGLKIGKVNEELETETGPYCETLKLNLETSCGWKGCKHYSTNHFWNCSRVGCERVEAQTEEVSKAVTKFTKRSISSIITEKLPPIWQMIQCTKYCLKCGSDQNLQQVTEVHTVCKSCIAKTPGKQLGLNLEYTLGRPLIDVMVFVIRNWHSIQEQSRALGISVYDMQDLCDIFSLDPKKYRTSDERHFSNPFHNRRKGRPAIDGYLIRLYSKYALIRRVERLRPEVSELNNFLLSQANVLLSSRNLEQFSLTYANF